MLPLKNLAHKGLTITQSGHGISFISHDMEPGVSIMGFISISEMDEEEVAMAINILRVDLTSLISILPAKKCVHS